MIKEAIPAFKIFDSGIAASLNVPGRTDKSNLRYLNLINAGTVNMGMKAYPSPFFSFPSRQLLCFWAFIPLSQPDFISTTWRGARAPPDTAGNAETQLAIFCQP